MTTTTTTEMAQCDHTHKTYSHSTVWFISYFVIRHSILH